MDQESTNKMESSSFQPDTLFSSIRSYPFEKDPEFQKGLSLILGHSATDEEVNSDDDLVLQAKCFYFSRYIPVPLLSS